MGVGMVARLRLDLSHLREHKFKHSFQGRLNPLCNCGMDIGSSTHFLLQWTSCVEGGCILMGGLSGVSPQISRVSLRLLTNTLFFRNSSYGDRTSAHVLSATIDCIRLAGGFDEPLLWLVFFFFFFSFMFLTNLPVCAVRGSSVVFFFGLRLGFVLFCFNCNCEIIVSYLLISYLTIVSFVFILLAGGWSMT